MTLHTYFTKRNILWFCAIALVVWVASVVLLDDKVKRSELPDDSIILVLGEYRFKVPVNYLYSMLLENELAKKKYGIMERKYKKVQEVDYFSITVTYPEMQSMTKPMLGWGNKIRIYLKHGEQARLFRKSAAAKTIESSPSPGSVPDGFNSSEILKFQDDFGGKSYIGNFENYLYKGDLIYMSCPRENTENTPPSPSCSMYSSYKNLEISANFSVNYKTEFIKINTLITELFQSFELLIGALTYD